MSLLNTVASLARSNTEAAKELLLRGSKSVTDNKRPFADSKIQLLGFVYMINLLSINWGLVQSVTGNWAVLSSPTALIWTSGIGNG